MLWSFGNGNGIGSVVLRQCGPRQSCSSFFSTLGPVNPSILFKLLQPYGPVIPSPTISTFLQSYCRAGRTRYQLRPTLLTLSKGNLSKGCRGF